MKLHDGLLFCIRELAMLQIRTKVICPSQPTTLPTSLETLSIRKRKEISNSISISKSISNRMSRRRQTGILRDETPVAGTMLGNVGRELVVLLRRPLPPLYIVLLATWDPPHLRKWFYSSGPLSLREKTVNLEGWGVESGNGWEC